MTERRFTQSELKDYRRCLRKWWLGWYRKLRLDPALYVPNAASLGTVVHEALRAAYTPGLDWRAVLQDFRTAGRERYAEQLTSLAKYDSQIDLAEIMVEGYTDWLVDEGPDSQIRVIANEQEVTAEVEGFTLLGKLDMLIEDGYDDATSFLDFKTVGSLDQIPNRAQIDEQFLHYATILRAADPRNAVAGGMWRMLRKVKRTARSSPPYYGEYRVRYTHQQMESYKTRLLGIIDRILMTELALSEGGDPLFIVPPNPTDSCRWDCQYREVCPAFDDGSRVEEFISDYYIQANPLDRYDTEDADE